MSESRSRQLLAVDDDRWLRFVESSEQALVTHHPSWTSMLAECYGYRTFVLALVNDAGDIVGGLPLVDVKVPLVGRKWVSLPFTDYAPPLLADSHLGQLLVDELGSLRRTEGVNRVEIRAPLAGAGQVIPRGFRNVPRFSSATGHPQGRARGDNRTPWDMPQRHDRDLLLTSRTHPTAIGDPHPAQEVLRASVGEDHQPRFWPASACRSQPSAGRRSRCTFVGQNGYVQIFGFGCGRVTVSADTPDYLERDQRGMGKRLPRVRLRPDRLRERRLALLQARLGRPRGGSCLLGGGR